MSGKVDWDQVFRTVVTGGGGGQGEDGERSSIWGGK